MEFIVRDTDRDSSLVEPKTRILNLNVPGRQVVNQRFRAACRVAIDDDVALAHRAQERARRRQQVIQPAQDERPLDVVAEAAGMILLVVLAIVILSLIPMALEIVRHQRMRLD